MSNYRYDGTPLSDFYMSGTEPVILSEYGPLGTPALITNLEFEQTTTNGRYILDSNPALDVLKLYSVTANYIQYNNSLTNTVPSWCKAVKIIAVGGGGGGGGGGAGSFSGNTFGEDDKNEGGNGGSGAGGQYITSTTPIAVIPLSSIVIVVGAGGGGGGGGAGLGDKSNTRNPGTPGNAGVSTTVKVGTVTYTARGGGGGTGGTGSVWNDSTNQPGDANPGTTQNDTTVGGVVFQGTSNENVNPFTDRPSISGGGGAIAFKGDISSTQPTAASSGGYGNANNVPQARRNGVSGGTGGAGYARVYYIP